ncbi:hypothetical protein V1525DRAFT_397490 [Lipomyces kononenkoae]|uniref:Uncharacterized protein n=1 Tax=Lipomyces kononenkoae TaxID=34357 RepID=A0ACC3T740_LIPKO
MHLPTVPTSTTSSTTGSSLPTTAATMDAIDRRIMGLRARLTPDPYCDPGFREEYVTYLSSGSSPNIRGVVSGLGDSAVDVVSSTGIGSTKDSDYHTSGTDHEPHISSESLEAARNSVGTRNLKDSALRESASKKDRQGDWDRNKRVSRDTKTYGTQDGEVNSPDTRSEGEKNEESVYRKKDSEKDNSRDKISRDSESIRTTDSLARDRDTDTDHNRRRVEKHKEVSKIREHDRTHDYSKVADTELDKEGGGLTRQGRHGSVIPPSPIGVSDEAKANKENPISHADIDRQSLSPLPSLLSPTLPAVFNSEGADAANNLGMITPTLPPYFESDLSGLGIRFTDDRGDNHRSTSSDSVRQSRGNSSIGKPRSRIVVLRIPSSADGPTTRTKRDISDNLKEDSKRQKVDNVMASRLHKGSSTGTTTPQLSTDNALSTSARLSKSSKAVSVAGSTPRSPRSEVTTPSLSPRPVLSSKEKPAFSIQNTSPSVATGRPSISSTSNDATSAPVTPLAKKSTLAEYSKRRLIGGGDPPVSPASHQNEFTNDKSDMSTSRKMSTTESSHNTPQRSSISWNSQAAQVLERKAQKWITVATDRKHESDRQKEAGNMQLASLYAMDSLLAYLVGFDYDDKFLSIKSRVPSDKNWNTLVPFTRHLVTLNESGKAPFLAGLSYQIRAVVYLRMAAYQRQTVKALQHSASPDVRDSRTAKSPETTASGSSTNTNTVAEVAELLTKASRNLELAAYDFQRGARMFPIEAVIERYPHTWRRRALAADYLSQSMPTVMGGGSSGPGLRPLEDQFVLPIQMYSSIREVAAFGASVLGEWADQNKLKYESVVAKGVPEQ